MDGYLKQYREMISLRGLTDHTLTAIPPTSPLTWDIFLISSADPRRRFPGLKCGILSAGSRRNGSFLTVPSMPVFPSCVFYHLCPAQDLGSVPASIPEV